MFVKRLQIGKKCVIIKTITSEMLMNSGKTQFHREITAMRNDGQKRENCRFFVERLDD